MSGDTSEAACWQFWRDCRRLLQGMASVRREFDVILNITHFNAYPAQQSTLPLKIISSEDVEEFLKRYPFTLVGRERGKRQRWEGHCTIRHENCSAGQNIRSAEEDEFTEKKLYQIMQ